MRFESWCNFRDLGGHVGEGGRCVRRGQLFRSMTPEYASAGDVAAARSLGIGLVIDLRGPRYETSGAIGEAPARRVAVGPARPLARGRRAFETYGKLPPEEALPEVLRRMGTTLSAAARALSDAQSPVLVHCRLGKDRTGVFAALILRLLGVEEEAVVEDYMRSAEEFEAATRLLQAHEQPKLQAVMTHSRVATEPPQRVAMQRTLELLQREYGGAEAYLRSRRISGRRIARLRHALLE